MIAVDARRVVAGLALALLLIVAGVYLLPPVVTEVSARLAERKVPIYKVARADKKLSISLDATWGADQTDRLLDILDAHGVKTTFFLAGYWVEEFPEYVKKIVERGHEVGNHSYQHPHLNTLTKEQIRRDLQRNHELLRSLTGHDTFLFRPPFGEYSNKVIEAAQELGYYTIQWSIDSLDWKDVSAEFMVNRILEKAAPGEIVLFHNAGKYTPQAIEMLLPRLKEAGYEVVPISELIYHEDYFVERHSGVQRPRERVNQ